MKNQLKIRGIFNLFFLGAVFFFTIKIQAQTAAELGEKLKSASNNEKAYLLNQLAEITLNQSADKSISYADMALQSATLLNEPNEKAAAYENLANGYEAQHDYKKAGTNFQNAATIYSQLKQYQTAGFLLSNMADACMADGRFEAAIAANQQAISQYNLVKDKKNVAACLMSIGDNYLKQKNYQEAIANYKTALLNFEELKDVSMTVKTENRIGSAYSNQGNYQEALSYLNKALDLAKKNKINVDAADIQKNIDVVKNNNINFDKSQTEYATKEKTEIVSQVQNQKQQINSLSEQKTKSIEEIEKLSIENQVKEYKIKAQQDELTYQKLEAINKVREIDLLKKDKELKEISIEKQRQIIFFIVITLLLVVVFFIFISRSLLVTKKQKALIHKQKLEVDTKNKQITDSIKAALPIQESILPKEQAFKRAFNDAFVLFLPKDIVSGDFYWIKNLGNEVLFAVIDCVGHGVPGAFMSLHAYNQLEYIVSQKNIYEPNLILDELNKAIVHTLKEDGDKDFVKSGMDMMLVKLNKITNEIEFSGAKNDLLVIHNGEITELKGDLLTIGNLFEKTYTFSKYTVAPGDMLYISSDGYKDQKGGSRNKSLYSGPFKQLLKDISTNPCQTQQIILAKNHLEWKHTHNQLDDICVMGIRI